MIYKKLLLKFSCMNNIQIIWKILNLNLKKVWNIKLWRKYQKRNYDILNKK